MQTQKMSLAKIQGKLSRAEMKNIMAGSADVCVKANKSCDPNGVKCCSTISCVQGSSGSYLCLVV